ncbi:hypothetical protein QO010_003508 [Caulobacter ginsengisoli]|uniref:DUF3885 domain-containing protein n=1 Tax=Caulobacter ginsengisoli TaxID=400775 RepID=A0ABU0IUL9_9CAUL|nr:DUF3885 domain-containing protein [Caulobacter ginsengisoli]MDQ0465716.1 hypothetical protein [Caulobacter ginsengisoli]
MDSSLSERLQEAFGVPAFPDGLFFEFDFALRFELAGDTRGGPARFLTAMDRARAVLAALFADRTEITVIAREFADQGSAPHESPIFEGLAGVGFEHSFFRHEVRPMASDDVRMEEDQVGICILHEAVMAPDAADFARLLWTPLATDMGVHPRVSGLSGVYLVDFERRVAVWPYDDRGMDVVAADASVIGPLAARFPDWLMGQRFGAKDS